MTTTNYGLRLRLAERDSFLIWMTDDDDRVLTSASGDLVACDTLAALKEYADAHGILLVDGEPAFYDIDAVVHWLVASEPLRGEDCGPFLDIWNLCSDIANSVPEGADLFKGLHVRSGAVYRKLFDGSGVLERVFDSSPQLQSPWGVRDIETLKKVLSAGVNLLRTKLRA